MQTMILYLLWPLVAYLAGSIPSGLIIVRMLTGRDIRRTGSGNIGATNVRRIVGNGWALAALLCDMLKGLLPVLGAILLVGTHTHWLPAISATAAVVGHMYPVYLKFTPSGKGVATAMGAFAMLTPLAALSALMVFILVVRKFRRVSLGSLIATYILPPVIWFAYHDFILTLSGLAVMVLILLRHEENLVRLARNKEPTLNGK